MLSLSYLHFENQNFASGAIYASMRFTQSFGQNLCRSRNQRDTHSHTFWNTQAVWTLWAARGLCCSSPAVLQRDRGSFPSLYPQCSHTAISLTTAKRSNLYVSAGLPSKLHPQLYWVFDNQMVCPQWQISASFNLLMNMSLMRNHLSGQTLAAVQIHRLLS